MKVSTAIEIFFNTQSAHPRCGLQKIGEAVLTPVRFWCGGSYVEETFEESIIKENDQALAVVIVGNITFKPCTINALANPVNWQKPWQKNTIPLIVKVAMAILFLPCLALGTVCKLVALANFPLSLGGCIQPVIVQQYRYAKIREQGQPTFFVNMSNAIKNKIFTDFHYGKKVLYKSKISLLTRIKYLDQNNPKAIAVNTFEDMRKTPTRTFLTPFRLLKLANE